MLEVRSDLSLCVMLAFGDPMLLGVRLVAFGAQGQKQRKGELPFGDVASVDMFIIEETAVELRGFGVDFPPSLARNFV